MSRHSFLRVVFSVCSGIGIFPEISAFPVYRTVIHFIIFAFLSTMLCVVLASSSLNRKISGFTSAFQKSFGGLEILMDKPDGIVPIDEPGRSRSLVAGRIRIDYLASGDTGAAFAPTTSESSAGILWLEPSAVLWKKKKGADFDYMPVDTVGGHGIILCIFSLFAYDYLPLKEVAGYGGAVMTGDAPRVQMAAKSSAFPAAGIEMMKEISQDGFLRPDAIATIISMICIICLFMVTWLKILFLVPLFALFASAFYFISGPELVFPAKYRNIANIAIYASYPGVIIAVLASGLGIRYLDFQTISALAFLAYFTYVLGKYQKRNRTETESSDNEEF